MSQERTCWNCKHCNHNCRLDSVGSGEAIYYCGNIERAVHEDDSCDKWQPRRTK